eukprot:52234-Pyramimonas_sp.AAC.1
MLQISYHTALAAEPARIDQAWTDVTARTIPRGLSSSSISSSASFWSTASWRPKRRWRGQANCPMAPRGG